MKLMLVVVSLAFATVILAVNIQRAQKSVGEFNYEFSAHVPEHGKAINTRHNISVSHGGVRADAGDCVSGKRGAPAAKLANCSVFGPNAMTITFPNGVDWAYAGVRPDPNYLCIGPDDNQPDDTTLTYQFDISHNHTSCVFQGAGGCSFPFPVFCLDPTLRQQLIDSGICRLDAPPQQIVDTLLFQLNRPGWLIVAVKLSNTFECWSADDDDNMCFTLTDTRYQIILTKVKMN